MKYTNVLQSHYTLREENFAEETFVSGKIREFFGRNFRELAVFEIFSEN